MKGRKLALRHLGIEPARIYLPFHKQLPAQSVAMSEYLAIALARFGGEVWYATKPPWTQMLAIVDVDLPRKIMDRPQQGPMVFTDASSATSTAAAVWQSGGEWHCVKMTDRAISVQQLEAAAVLLACGLTQQNISTYFYLQYRIIGHPCNPYTLVTREDDKLASGLSASEDSAPVESRQRRYSPCRGVQNQLERVNIMFVEHQQLL
ncbi:uncharacterized protein LOC129784356 [Falco peregrinus]|uniref:uncharacterized protein LOC129784356 n=1 Tax=Falco peregrinus TaxID=8954 RepID=UPI002478F13C|nr:uncharacterized protein LOC129784356 [Falco peregrinus]